MTSRRKPSHVVSVVIARLLCRLLTLFTVEYTNLSHTLERDIFQRVQLGMPLTAAGE